MPQILARHHEIAEILGKGGLPITACAVAEVAALLAPADTSPLTKPSNDVRETVRQEIINAPETADFMAGVPLEAAHQRDRWGVSHDGGKTPFDWFWLIGYLAQKAATAQQSGDMEKAKHHTISTAAALANWHAQIEGLTAMRPGIGPGNGGDDPASAFGMASALLRQPEQGRECDSCGGLNTLCPDGCERDPDTGELRATLTNKDKTDAG